MAYVEDLVVAFHFLRAFSFKLLKVEKINSDDDQNIEKPKPGTGFGFQKHALSVFTKIYPSDQCKYKSIFMLIL